MIFLDFEVIVDILLRVIDKIKHQAKVFVLNFALLRKLSVQVIQIDIFKSLIKVSLTFLDCLFSEL